ncbi:lysine-specific demethylase 4A isoform X1 [Rana temporaria]|uniref:lysine-specific demethylase 4A isoform X1 n=1 Tax=Rana temporaria TaxID=8407 RepID=UPI001AAE0ED2|nr:lysine-specific demethylase 4A isoform X1 [Rana temporaria]XP_040216849.1 lysine-specific demethylase 4A isoform X1 [Rana temporaria]
MAGENENPNPGSRIMTFYPTMEEFRNFKRYIAYIESQGAHRAGLAKVVPPKEWKPRVCYDDLDDLVIPAPIQQVVTGQSGLFTQYNIQKKPMTVKEFRRIANSDKFCTPRYADFEDLERKYWKNLTFNAPIYGADVNGTLYDKQHVDDWNIGKLNTILDVVERESGITIEGVNTPYLYFGMWKTSFAWHTEDMDLYSINYLHFGEPKSWYAIPPEHGKRLERLAKGFFPGSAQSCEAFLRHKMTVISPFILKKYGIPFDKVTQEAGEFMVTFPYGYHAGFNHGFNCAESTNFATLRWIEYGKQAVLCSCRKDMVKISMDVFVRKFQPERYKQWKVGKDFTAIDHTQPTPEAAEFVDEHNESEQKKSVTKHRIGTKRHRVCLEVPEELNQNEEDFKEVPCEMETTCVNEVKEEECSPEDTEPGSSGQQYETLKNVENYGMPENYTPYSNPASPSSSADSSSSSQDSSADSAASSDTDSDSQQRSMSRKKSGAHSYSKGKSAEQKKTSSMGSFTEHELKEVAEKHRNMQEHQNAKSRRQPLCKLPRYHPLVMKESGSEDDQPEQTLKDDEFEEMEPWAKPLSQLWQNKPQAFQLESEYNLALSRVPPHCSVCLLFRTYYQSNCEAPSTTDTTPVAFQLKTKPLIPEMCFTTTSCNTDLNLSAPYLEEDGTSLLISCRKCNVCVHASCYGVSKDKAVEGWMCSRCEEDAMTQDCCLCTLRGGALQKANDNRWVHVMCAVAIAEAKFVNIAERRPVDISKIPLMRFRLKCAFCKKRRKRVAGCCVQCSHGRCPTSFHVSCAQAAGVMMQPDDWPFVVFITCSRHKPSQNEGKDADRDIVLGQTVIAKHKNGRYYQSEVVKLTKETFYEVNFDDGSFSDNLFPEDIVSRDCLNLGPPAAGDIVQVRWTDGLVYGAKFVASHTIQMYQVEFEDGAQLPAKRDDVYTLDEELPKKVKSRLSVASDMRFTEIFTEQEVKQEVKRQRVINSRYREDYIEPALYRAIME